MEDQENADFREIYQIFDGNVPHLHSCQWSPPSCQQIVQETSRDHAPVAVRYRVYLHKIKYFTQVVLL